MLFDNIKKIGDKLSKLYSQSGNQEQLMRKEKQQLIKQGCDPVEAHYIVGAKSNAEQAFQILDELSGRLADLGWKVVSELKATPSALMAETKLAVMGFKEYRMYKQIQEDKAKKEAKAKEEEKKATEGEDKTIKALDPEQEPYDCEKHVSLCCKASIRVTGEGKRFICNECNKGCGYIKAEPSELLKEIENRKSNIDTGTNVEEAKTHKENVNILKDTKSK